MEVFQDLTGQEPVLTNPADNYFSQWSMLLEQFRILWATNGNVVEAPRLVARDRWTGGISQYYLAEEIGLADEDEDEDEDEQARAPGSCKAHGNKGRSSTRQRTSKHRRNVL